MSKATNTQSYNANADRYAQVSEKSAPWLYFDQPALDAELPTLNKTTKILEVGCGGGKVIGYLCSKGADEQHVTGIDISSELLDVAKQHHPKAQFIQGDISTVQVPQEAFDMVVAVRILEYLSNDDLAKTLKMCHRALRPGGVVLIIVGHPLRVNGPDITLYSKRGARQHTVPGGVPVTLFHKTVADYVNTSVQAGFTLASMHETEPSAALKKASPADYARYSTYGAVTLVLRLMKP